MGPVEVRPRVTKTSSSEQKLQSQLNGTAAAGADDRVGSGHIRSGASATEVSGGRIVETESILSSVGIGKVRMVENVKEFRSELSAKPFPKLPVLRDRETCSGSCCQIARAPEES